jgi:peptidoglycan-associated lipoprotein
MHTMTKYLGILSVLLLVSACETAPTTGGGASGEGAGGAGTGMENAGGEVTPGTQADLEKNVGDRVFFDYDSSTVKSEGQETLHRQAEWLKQYPNLSITIEGHCDERGTREYNLALGERRAAAVKSYLMSLGVSGSRLQTISYGKERPAVVGSDEQAWAQNRRGVTVVNQ